MEKIGNTLPHIDSISGAYAPSIQSNRLIEANKLALRLKDRGKDAVWFYYKIIDILDADTIDRLAVAALEKGKKPGAYFNMCVTNELRKKELENE